MCDIIHLSHLNCDTFVTIFYKMDVTDVDTSF